MTKRQSGILPDADIRALYEKGNITAGQPLDDDQIQPASLDLRLGETAYRVRASFLPGKDHTVADKLKRLMLHEFDLKDGAVLETGCVYIVPLLEQLDLPADILASANPKSSTGRLDIFTRVIANNSQQFDKLPPGYAGPLYLEVSPRTFPIVVRTGSKLSQIRFCRGEALLSADEMQELQTSETLVSTPTPLIDGRGVGMSIDLSGNKNGLIGYRGKRHTGVVDVDKPDFYEIHDFWEPIYDHGSPDLVLDPDQFYILVSREAIHVPPAYAAEMVPFDPLVGEFRVHYAGFFDPGFGHAKAGGAGSRAVLEVRSHEVPFILEHGQIVGRLMYQHMLASPAKLYGVDLSSNYQAQGLKLSKHFRRPGDN